MDIFIRAVISALIAYLLGSINFAIIFTKITDKNTDIRKMGSGNAGFTNVLRSVGKGPAILTIVFDFLKGIIAVLISWWMFSAAHAGSAQTAYEYCVYGKYLAGLFAIVGHMFPVFFGFKGGKGVVTAAALMAVVDWRVFLLILVTFLILFFATKIISLSSIICGILYGIYTFIFSYFVDYIPSLSSDNPFTLRYVIISTICAAAIGWLVIFKHKENIKRILKGEEKKITAKK